MSLEYVPTKLYSTVYAENNLGNSLWSFLIDYKTVGCLIDATYKDKPAVAGIDDALLDRFAADVNDPNDRKRDDTVK